MKKPETKELLQKKGWKFKVSKTGHIAIHESGLREYAPTLCALFKKIRGY